MWRRFFCGLGGDDRGDAEDRVRAPLVGRRHDAMGGVADDPLVELRVLADEPVAVGGAQRAERLAALLEQLRRRAPRARCGGARRRPARPGTRRSMQNATAASGSSALAAAAWATQVSMSPRVSSRRSIRARGVVEVGLEVIGGSSRRSSTNSCERARRARRASGRARASSASRSGVTVTSRAAPPRGRTAMAGARGPRSPSRSRRAARPGRRRARPRRRASLASASSSCSSLHARRPRPRAGGAARRPTVGLRRVASTRVVTAPARASSVGGLAQLLGGLRERAVEQREQRLRAARRAGGRTRRRSRPASSAAPGTPRRPESDVGEPRPVGDALAGESVRARRASSTLRERRRTVSGPSHGSARCVVGRRRAAARAALPARSPLDPRDRRLGLHAGAVAASASRSARYAPPSFLRPAVLDPRTALPARRDRGRARSARTIAASRAATSSCAAAPTTRSAARCAGGSSSHAAAAAVSARAAELDRRLGVRQRQLGRPQPVHRRKLRTRVAASASAVPASSRAAARPCARASRGAAPDR